MLGGLAKLNPFGAKAAVPPAVAPAAGAGAGEPLKGLGPEWKMFTPPAGGFSVAMPGDPKEVKVSAPSPAGPVQVVLYMIEVGKDGYIVAGNDLPPGSDAPALVQTVLDGSQKGIMANLAGAKLIEEKKIQHQGFPGRDLVVEVPPGKAPTAVTVRIRIVIANGKLIQMQAIRAGVGEAAKATPEIPAYFNSLKIGNNKQANAGAMPKPVTGRAPQYRPIHLPTAGVPRESAPRNGEFSPLLPSLAETARSCGSSTSSPA